MLDIFYDVLIYMANMEAWLSGYKEHYKYKEMCPGCRLGALLIVPINNQDGAQINN